MLSIRRGSITLLAFSLVTTALVVGVAQGQAGSRSVSGQPETLVREERRIAVGGIREIWRLEWKGRPRPVCEPSDTSLTCPCMGFAYGQGGDLYLVRVRAGVEFERFHVTPLFPSWFPGESHTAVVRRWNADYKRDFEASQREDFETVVSKRPAARVMQFADYDHDGSATEFYLQTDSAPCGKSIGVVIGISKANPRLHAFVTASEPSKVIYMQRREWEALRDASGPIDISDWECGDHGANTEIRLRLMWNQLGIDGGREEYTCDVDSAARRLIGRKPL